MKAWNDECTAGISLGERICLVWELGGFGEHSFKLGVEWYHDDRFAGIRHDAVLFRIGFGYLHVQLR